jgi:putative transposase
LARPWRIQYGGAYYHVLSRGNEARDIFFDDGDRNLFLSTLGETSVRFKVDVFAFVLMRNHYHLLLRTNSPNLSMAMQWLGLYCSAVSHIVRDMKEHIKKDPRVGRKVKKLNSQFKM